MWPILITVFEIPAPVLLKLERILIIARVGGEQQKWTAYSAFIKNSSWPLLVFAKTARRLYWRNKV